jgi:hypothetical protein
MMRKTALSLALLFCISMVAFGTASCSQGNDSFLEVTTTNSTAYLIPAAASSCTNTISNLNSPTGTITPDIQSKYFTVRGLKFTWNHAYNTLNIALIRLNFTSDGLGGNYTCEIGGDELSSLKYAPDTSIPPKYFGWSASIPPSGDYNKKVSVTMNCDIHCGGIKTQNTSFTATGSMDVVGYMTTPSGDQAPVHTSIPFSIENIF